VSAVRERPVRLYSEVFTVSSEKKRRVVVVLHFKLTFSFLIIRMEVTNIVFVVLSCSFQVWRYSPTVAASLVSSPSTACQSPSACMIGRSTSYAFFLETVVGRSEM